MVELIKKKIKAFTLVESIVSLTLISVTVGACFLLFNQVAVHDHTRQQARLLAENYLIQLEQGDIDIDQNYFEKEGFSIDVNLLTHEGIEQLLHVKISVSRKEKLLYKTDKLIVVHED